MRTLLCQRGLHSGLEPSTKPGLEAQIGVWEPAVCSRLRWQRGGAALLADLIEVSRRRSAPAPYSNSASPIRRGAPDPPRMPYRPEDARYHHFYATWMPFPFSAKVSRRRSQPGGSRSS